MLFHFFCYFSNKPNAFSIFFLILRVLSCFSEVCKRNGIKIFSTWNPFLEVARRSRDTACYCVKASKKKDVFRSVTSHPGLKSVPAAQHHQKQAALCAAWQWQARRGQQSITRCQRVVVIAVIIGKFLHHSLPPNSSESSCRELGSSPAEPRCAAARGAEQAPVNSFCAHLHWHWLAMRTMEHITTWHVV